MLVLFTALIAPFFIDWTAWRQAFEREASRIVGQPVTVAGDAKVRLLPLPSVTFADLAVGRYPDGQPMMTVHSFSMNMELMPLLSGEIRIVDMTLDRPNATIRINDNGSVDWTSRKEMLVDPDRVKIDRLIIQEGDFAVIGLAGGRSVKASGISAEISAQSLTGPWRISARGLMDGIPGQLDLTSGRIQDDGALRIKLATSRFDAPYRLSMDGAIGLRENVLGWAGGFELVQTGKSDLAGAEASEPLPIFLSGQFDATPRAFQATEYRLEVGPREDPYTISGDGQIDFGQEIRFHVTADGRQIDLDQLEAVEAGPSSQGSGGLDDRLAALRAIVDRIPIPPIAGTIDLALPAIIAGDTVVREISAVVRPETDSWRIDRLEATVPGNTKVEARGRLGIREDFGFHGNLLVASRQPTGLANWLSGTTNAPLRNLTSAGLEARVTLTSSQSTFEDMELVLDGLSLRGKLQRLAPAGGRPAIVAELRGARVDLDNLIAIYALAQNPEGRNLTSHDLDVTIDAAVFQAQGLEAAGVDARIKVEAGALSIDRFNAREFYGATITSEGRIVDLLDRASGSFRLHVTAEDASRLAGVAIERLGSNRFLSALAADPVLVADLDVVLTVDARPQQDGTLGSIGLTGRMGGTQIQFRDRFAGEPARWAHSRHDLTLKLVNDSAAILASQLSIPVLPVDSPGPVTLDAEFSGIPVGTLNGVFALQAPESDFSATGSIGFPPAVVGDLPDTTRPSLAFDITMGSQDAEPWMMLAGHVLPGMGQGSPLSLSFRLTGNERRYAIADLAGQYAGSAISGAGSIDLSRQGRVGLEGDYSVETVSIAYLAELIAGAGSFAAANAPGDGSDPGFSPPLLAGLDADIALTADWLDLGQAVPASAFTGRLKMFDGSLSLSDMAFQWLGGQATGNLNFANKQGNGVVQAQLGLTGFNVGEAVALAGYRPFVGGTANLSVTLDGSGRTRQALLASLAGSGVLRIKDGEIRGIGTGGLASILAAADTEGFEITRDTVLPVARSGYFGGTMSVPSLEAAFSVAQGRVMARNLAFGDAGGRIEAEASASLSDGETRVRLIATLDPGEDALPGAEPAIAVDLVGLPETMTAALDTSQLEGYLSLRAFEREQRRVALLEASVLEKQRMRREIIATNTRIALREQKRREELRQLEELQRKFEEEQRQREAEEAERKADQAQAREPAIEPVPQDPVGAPAVIIRELAPPPGNTNSTTDAAPSGPSLFDNLEKLLGN